jgi:hypothetical protein
MQRDHVSHYADTKYETIDVIFDKLGFDGGVDYVLGNIIKYSTRAKHKGQFVSDIEKIRNYATILLEKIEDLQKEHARDDTPGMYL